MAGLVVAGHPGEQARAGVEDGAGREIAHGDGEAVAVGVGSGDGQRQGFAFRQGDVANVAGAVDDRGVVATADGNVEALGGDAAAAVLHAHDDFSVGKVAGAGRPVEGGEGMVAVGCPIPSPTLPLKGRE